MPRGNNYCSIYELLSLNMQLHATDFEKIISKKKYIYKYIKNQKKIP